jgi:hypothetical protein
MLDCVAPIISEDGKDKRLTKSSLILVARFMRPARRASSSHRLVVFLMLPFSPGTWVVTVALTALLKSPWPVVSTTAVTGPAPSEVTMWKVPEMEALVVLIWGRVEPDRAMDLATPVAALFFPPAWFLVSFFFFFSLTRAGRIHHSLAAVVGADIECRGVKLGLCVGSCAGDYGSFNSESSSVTTQIAGNDCNLPMCCNKRTDDERGK